MIMKTLILVTAMCSSMANLTSIIITLRHPIKVHTYFLMQLFIASFLSMICLIVNIMECDAGTRILSTISAQLYLTFNQASLAWIAIICFTQFYVMTSNQRTFLKDLAQSTHKFTIAAYLIPFIFSLIPTLLTLTQQQDAHSNYYDCLLTMSQGSMICVALILPTLTFLIIMALYNSLCYKYISHFKTILGELYVLGILRELVAVPFVVFALFIPIMITEIAFDFTASA